MALSSIAFLRENDPLLEPLLAAADDAAREAVLEALILRHAEPVARRVVGRYRTMHGTLASEDADDVVATVHLRLVRRLRALTALRDEPIARFEDYVATLTYHAVYDVLRRRFPERMRLKNRLRYLLERDARFATWLTAQGTICGLREWQGQPAISAPEIAIGDLRGADAILAVFRAAQGPLMLDDLVSVLAAAWHVADVVEVAATTEPATFATATESRDFIARLWNEIALLPQPQRAALLLNLRDADGGNAIAAFVLLGIASVDSIAGAVGIAPEALAALWNELPIVDDRIAEMLGRTRQQIISLRKAARARLTRRLGKELS